MTTTLNTDASGAVSTSAIPLSINRVACNSTMKLEVTSQSGGVTTHVPAPPGFTNVINYTATATIGGISSTIDTSTNPVATGPEKGNAATATNPIKGSVTLTITPQQPTAPLMPGSYSDALTVKITPQ